MSGSKDGHTIFHGILPATTRGLASKTAINWHLKVKNIEYNVGLTNNYCITVSMQKVSSIHKLIQQILGSHELNDHAHFWPDPPKNHWNKFLLSWICTTMQKISSFLQFILEIYTASFRDLWSDWPHPFLATPIKKNSAQLLSYVNLHQHAKTRAISLICSGDIVD